MAARSRVGLVISIRRRMVLPVMGSASYYRKRRSGSKCGSRERTSYDRMCVFT